MDGFSKQSIADTHPPAPLIPIKRDPHCGSNSKGKGGTSLLSDIVRERTFDGRIPNMHVFSGTAWHTVCCNIPRGWDYGGLNARMLTVAA